MKQRAAWLFILFFFPPTALPEAPNLSKDEHKALVIRSSDAIWLVPTMANLGGRFGAYFKTRVVIYNPTEFSYPIDVTLYGPDGEVGSKSIHMESGKYRVYDNFLDEVFNYRGAGAVEFDSWFDPEDGSSDYKYSVTAEVYVDSPNGRYTTVVMNGEGEELLGYFIDEDDRAFNPGITVNSGQRANIGIFNDGFGSALVHARVSDGLGNHVQTVEFDVPRNTWDQKAITTQIENGFVEWVCPNDCNSVYLWAVTVDNKSNDGSFFPAIGYSLPDE